MNQFPETQGSPFHRATSLKELLFFNDVDFVICAYVTILGRQPDVPGRVHHVQQIRAGDSKLGLLLALRQSHEGKQHDPGIAGLDRELKRAAKQRRPFMGAISRFLRSDADSSSRSDRSMRVLINATFVNQRHLQTIAEQMTAGSGLHSPALIGPGSGLEANPSLQPASFCLEVAKSVKDSPELGHLRRRKGSLGRPNGGVRP